MQALLVAPCGMNCGICSAFLGEQKTPCPGCLPRDKQCAFLKKKCKKIGNQEIRFCFECNIFPCENLQKLDKNYKKSIT